MVVFEVSKHGQYGITCHFDVDSLFFCGGRVSYVNGSPVQRRFAWVIDLNFISRVSINLGSTELGSEVLFE